MEYFCMYELLISYYYRYEVRNILPSKMMSEGSDINDINAESVPSSPVDECLFSNSSHPEQVKCQNITQIYSN